MALLTADGGVLPGVPVASATPESAEGPASCVVTHTVLLVTSTGLRCNGLCTVASASVEDAIDGHSAAKPTFADIDTPMTVHVVAIATGPSDTPHVLPLDRFAMFGGGVVAELAAGACWVLVGGPAVDAGVVRSFEAASSDGRLLGVTLSHQGACGVRVTQHSPALFGRGVPTSSVDAAVTGCEPPPIAS